MESTSRPLIQKWLLCLICGFVGIFLLSLYCSDTRDGPATAVSEVLHHGLDLHLLPHPKLTPPPSDPSKQVAHSPQPNSPLDATPKQARVQNAAAAPSSRPLQPQTSNLASQPKPLPRTQSKICNLFEGKWVYDPQRYPLYSEKECPFLSQQVNCQKNGRPDSDYMHWRWEAQGCRIPRFNGTDMLERLRGKRVVIVGDSLNRNQWESLACLLYSSLPPSRTIVKNGASYKLFQAMDYKSSVEFYWSPFLVNVEETQTGDKVLKLDHMPPESRRWKGAHVLVFNTAHWWTHSGRMRSWKYYERKGKLVEEMKRDYAYEIAMRTWARWIDRHVNSSRTRVFFRSVSPEHKRTNLHWCYNQTNPITSERYIKTFPSSMASILERTIQEMRTRVTYLNVTGLSELRRDGHTSLYTTRKGVILTNEERKSPEKYADCSHWCLPGIPDTWNTLLYASIVRLPSAIM
ncbi:hypothetical protein HPP92_024283 [Vanilla planifolia]|uniref:Trichome birefringence-like N-terminal domain-containing protein n=1 Tax=Vanilla planifolia TaxID=51239 RepID=A0A835PQ06_VANPL|nr:hypothetical protein HPP92_024283 [Vanilla planifolia]